MNLQLFQRDLQKMNKKYNIKNINEIYIETTSEEVKALVNSYITDYKLRFVAEFCRQEESFVISIILRNKIQGYFTVVYYKTDKEIVSLQDIIFQSNLFEREITDLYGLTIIGGRDTRNLVKHESWEKDVYPLRKNFAQGRKILSKNEISEYIFKGITGVGGYQIPVGPVHAGIIEPGHFRFSVIGEEIENLELRLMYKHRGIEKLAENMTLQDMNLLFERVAGESSASYAESYALLIEKLMGYEVSREIKALRIIILELERIYNYLDDIAGICVDVGYSYPAKKYGYFSEQIHQLCERITGSRFLRNSIIPCGINIDFDNKKAMDILVTLGKINGRMNDIMQSTLNSVSFLDRVENTGLVYNEKAKRLSMTGVVGRASDIAYDVRRSFPYELYKEIKHGMNVEVGGGVFERYKLKIAEIRDAFTFIEKAIEIIDVDIPKEKREIVIKEGSEALAAVETVKGELVVYGKVGENNKFSRIYFKTPSFANWGGLSYAILNEIVPDFPLCNKSFNMSYSENDR
jgi:Ni,Fe-hydrogenase III large subunit/Ni,Fe-hydrogenase III component G